MESWEYYRATFSPVPAPPASPSVGDGRQQAGGGGLSSIHGGPGVLPAVEPIASTRSTTPDSSLLRRGRSAGQAGAGAGGVGASGSGSWAADEWPGSSQWEEECESPGSYEYAAQDIFVKEAAATIKHQGWLLKASGKGPHRKWRKHWVYLKDDRLCYTPDPGGAGGVRYIPLDRIPVRALPRGYGPKVGVTLVDARQLDTSSLPPPSPLPAGSASPGTGCSLPSSRHRSGGGGTDSRTGCLFSVACGAHTHFWAAQTPDDAKAWVEAVTRAWVKCVKHTARGSQPSMEELLAMREAKWQAENDALRRSLAAAEAGRQEAAEREGEQWRAWLDSQPPSSQQQQQQEEKQEGQLEEQAVQTEQEVDYEVQVATGTCKGAGTSSQVYLEVFGREEERSSGEQRLVPQGGKSTQPSFQRGATDTFTMRCKELGELVKVRVFHDCSGPSPSWFLEEVRIRRAACGGIRSNSSGSAGVGTGSSGGVGAGGDGSWTIFPCGRWLAADQDDGRVMRDLWPGEPRPQVAFKITTVTSNIRGADTDSNVHIILHGSRGDGARHGLSSGPNDFERGAVNEFVAMDYDLGDLEAVTIGHDGSGLRPAWHVQQVTVSCPATGAEWLFPCRQWFDAGSSDGKLERRLQAGRAAPEPCWYTVVICTSEMRGAGTTSEVFLGLHGSEGSSPRVKLPSQAGDFERGQEDVFRVQLPCVGTLQRLTVGHNSAGALPEWHLEQVEVTEESTGDTMYFECGQWLSRAKGDGLTERTLVASPANPRDRLASYRLALHTSDLRAAGTSANVWAELHGAAGSSGVQKLQSTPQSYARGAIDTFTFTCASLGDLKKLTVGHDNSGPAPSWHLHKAVVTCNKSGAVTEFPCNRWLASGEDDGCITRDLYPNSMPTKLVQYNVTVHTSDLRGGGTTAKVYLEVVGRQHKVGPLHLENDKANFQRGRTDIFQITERDVGEVQHIRVWHDSSGSAGSWHLHFIELASNSGGPPLFFPCNDWLAGAACERVLEPTLSDPRLSMTNYEVTVYTSDIKGAGSDASLSLILHGASGSSCALPLAGGAGSFERGKEDHFSFTLPGVGQLQRLTLQSDGSGSAPAWHCDMVSVQDGRSGETVYFPCDRWLDETQGLLATLEATPRDPRLDYKAYQLAVTTSNFTRSGTDGDVYVELVGSARSSGWRKVCPSGQSSGLERGKECRVELQLRDLGPLKNAKLRVENQTFGWHLQSAEVLDVAAGDRWLFPCQSWLNERHGLECSLPAFRPGDMEQYRLRLHTSDIPGAGSTDLRIWVELMGQGSQTQRMWLGPTATTPGQVSEHTLSWGGLGELRQLVVGHDGTGSSPSWHLDYVEVERLTSGQALYFDCNQWLSKDHGDGKLEQTLAASSVDPSFSRCAYQLTVHTSNMRAAGLPEGMAVSVVLAGSKGALPRSQLKRAGAFLRSQQDTFQLVGPDIGAFTRLSLRVEDLAGKAAWHLGHVEATNLKTGQRGLFVCRDWVQSSGAETELSAGDGSALDDVEYEVVVHTSDVRSAGTEADVLLELHGSRGSSGTLALPASGQASFRRGAADTFHVLAPECGELQELHVWHTGKKSEDAWHLEYVEVTNRATGATSFFSCGAWVAEWERKVLPAAKEDPALSRAMYKVVVHTSDIKGAGTDASIFLELRGELRSSGRVELGSAEAAFERGGSDSLTLKLPKLGKLQEAVVGHDGKGRRPSWHLDCIEVHELQTGIVSYFKCGEWLSESKGTGATQRTLKAQEDNPRASLIKYRVVVNTSDLRGAGTDASVSIQFFGLAGETRRMELEGGGELAFERGRRDEFALSAPGVGRLRKVWVGHDNKGNDAAWHLKEVSVLDTSSGEQYLFECNAWVEGEGSPVGVELYPSAAGGQPSQARQTRYEVVVKTGDLRDAGTDADVTIRITGSSGSGSQKLAAGPGAFRRGGTDCFVLQLPPLGTLERLEVSRNTQGQQQGWFLEWVKVTDCSSGQEYHFFASCWIDQEHGLAAVLQPGHGKQYKVFVHTSNLAGAGTDCGVYITLHGTAGNGEGSGRLLLSSKGMAFDRGSSCEFVLETKDLGELERVIIGHDSQGTSKSWHCASVEAGPLGGPLVTFPCNSWLSKEKGDGLTERALYPEGSPGALVAVAYKVVIHTSGDMPAAGTSRPVGLELHGAHNVAGPILLENDGSYFGQGSVDSFRVEAADVGEMQQLRVWVEPPVDASCRWFLDLVEVTNETSGKTAFFTCRKWLEGRNSFEATLLASNSNPMLEEVDYKISIYTTAILGAETSGSCILDIIGEKARSGVLTLRNKGGASFRAGQRDDFHVRLPRLGALQELQVGHDGPRAWHLDKLEVSDSDSGTTYFFPADCWVDSSRTGEGVWLKPKVYTTDPASLPVQYQCTLMVEEARGNPGSDALLLTVFGTRGDTGAQTLDLSKFMRTGRPDITTYFEAANVGQIERIRLGLAEQEAECSVLISSIEIVNRGTGEEAVFANNEWLSSADDYDLELAVGQEPEEVLCSYRVEVQTSDLRRAGASGHAYLTIIGDRDRIGPYQLSNEDGSHFKRGQLDVFQVSDAPDVGQLRQIEVRHDGQGKKAGWHLAWVKVSNEDTGAVAMFNCHRWIDKQTGDPQVVGTAMPLGPSLQSLASKVTLKERLLGKSAPPTHTADYHPPHGAGEAEVAGAAAGGQTGYRVSFHTSRGCGSGTRARVFFELMGDRGSSGVIMPVAGKHSFSPGRVDVFTFHDMPSLGELKAVRVGSDGTGIFPGWHLRMVEVVHLPTGSRKVFGCYKWVDKACNFFCLLQLDEESAGAEAYRPGSPAAGPRRVAVPHSPYGGSPGGARSAHPSGLAAGAAGDRGHGSPRAGASGVAALQGAGQWGYGSPRAASPAAAAGLGLRGYRQLGASGDQEWQQRGRTRGAAGPLSPAGGALRGQGKLRGLRPVARGLSEEEDSGGERSPAIAARW